MRSVLARAAQDSTRLVDVQGTIFETPDMNDCFAQERTVAKNAAMTELRTSLPLAAVPHFNAFLATSAQSNLPDAGIEHGLPRR